MGVWGVGAKKKSIALHAFFALLRFPAKRPKTGFSGRKRRPRQGSSHAPRRVLAGACMAIACVFVSSRSPRRDAPTVGDHDTDLNPTRYTVPQKDGVSRERRRGAEAHSYGGLVRSRFGEAVSTSRRTNFRAHFHGLL